MPDPLFTPADRVETPPPPGQPDLANMTPAQIAAHYQAREQTIIANAQRVIDSSRNTPPNRQPDLTADQFADDPVGSTRDILRREGVTRQEFDQMSRVAQSTLEQAAKAQAREGKKYWTRLEQVITQMTQNADPMARLEASFWETAYHAALGQTLSTIQAEEGAAAAAQRASLEAPSGGSTPPEPPRILTTDEIKVCDGLGLTHDQFRKGEQNMRSNVFPVTLDNRRR
jgi:hypothetical protein